VVLPIKNRSLNSFFIDDHNVDAVVAFYSHYNAH